MFTKALFLVLLGAAFVLSNPIPEAGSNELSVAAVTEKVENVAADSDDVIPEIDILIVDNNEVTATTVAPHQNKVEKIKNEIVKWFNKSKENFKHIKEVSKEAYQKIKNQFKTAKDETLKLVDQIQSTYKVVKEAGQEAVAEFKKLYTELKTEWSALKKAGKKSYDQIAAVAKDSKKQFMAIQRKFSKTN